MAETVRGVQEVLEKSDEGGAVLARNRALCRGLTKLGPVDLVHVIKSNSQFDEGTDSQDA